MNEREMLEMAAKAAGFELRFSPEWHDVGEPQIIVNRGRCTDWEYWNPLQDDGDALRLAVAVGVNAIQCHCSVDAMHFDSCIVATEMFTDHGNDKVAATRLAITRAAAQIGKSMP